MSVGAEVAAGVGSGAGAAVAADEAFARDWQGWQDRRLAAAGAPHGPASLTLTFWFADDTPQSVPGLPGQWAAEGERLVATGFAPGEVRFADGADATAPLVLDATTGDVHAGERILRRFERDGVPALRIFDPAAEGRTSLRGIAAFDPDPAWRLEARFEPDPRARTIELADGYQKETETSGSIVFTRDGVERRLTGTLRPDGISVVFGDTTNGDESYGFRFLTVGLPDADGATVIDFNRAFLPPCAFSDQFVCPLPTPENRLPVAIRAGERLTVRE
ncbi:DUF1684 domain-containing protein [Leucobacter rhizosphaerae]|uniref:DUF1684 domain-containing protein n=1 Tax=Leucobacter rhizosphaerae TaxID=2932245 RepID=A0ABY4FVM7_9MICO|nr:DUF1684 domain-containing protein [Leucobacter rhizosphaerae]UOQ60325.1 DUF1684 domain-containing protein [Leucobacter rhizosphaerae]